MGNTEGLILSEPIQIVNLKQYWTSGSQRDDHFSDILGVRVLVPTNSLYNSSMWPMEKEDDLHACECLHRLEFMAKAHECHPVVTTGILDWKISGRGSTVYPVSDTITSF